MINKLKNIESFSYNYRGMSESETLAFNQAHSWEAIRQDWWLALLFFFDRAFYQGRSDILSGYFEKASVNAINTVLIGSSSEKLILLKQYGYWLIRENWRMAENPLWNALSGKYDIGRKTKYGTGRKRDKEMVLDSLKFIMNDCEDNNILKHSIQNIQKGHIARLSEELQGIVSVGVKISSLFLRDIIFLYDLEYCLQPEDYYLIMPIDTWVKKISDNLGIKADAKTMATICQQNGVSPIKFNQGAWYLGSHSFPILLDMLSQNRLPSLKLQINDIIINLCYAKDTD